MTALAYLHLPPDAPLARPPVPAPFKAVLVLEAPADPDWRAQVSTWLVDGGCLYAMTWGTDCEAWHDAIDDAFIAAHPDDLPGDDQLIMTTWHDDEPLEEVARFAAHDATHPSGELAAALVLHIADAPRQAALLATFRAPCADDGEHSHGGTSADPVEDYTRPAVAALLARLQARSAETA